MSRAITIAECQFNIRDARPIIACLNRYPHGRVVTLKTGKHYFAATGMPDQVVSQLENADFNARAVGLTEL
jgi:hypothetical protein